MDLIHWLQTYVARDLASAGAAAVACGALVFAAIEFINWWVPLPGPAKRILAGLLSVTFPPAAYWALAKLTKQELTVNGWFLSAAVAVATATLIHKGWEAWQARQAKTPA